MKLKFVFGLVKEDVAILFVISPLAIQKRERRAGNSILAKSFSMEASNLEESDLKGMEVCNFGGTEMALPLDLIEQVNQSYCKKAKRNCRSLGTVYRGVVRQRTCSHSHVKTGLTLAGTFNVQYSWIGGPIPVSLIKRHNQANFIIDPK